MKDEDIVKASFIIPTLNEQASIQSTIEVGFACDLIDEVIVVDGKSEDLTYLLALEAGAQVITQPNSGKGDAIRAGLKSARNPIAVFMDADILNIRPEMIRRLVETVIDGADFVVADFDREGGRVTELTAKPMLKKFFPEIDVNQPLAGEFAGRTNVLRSTPIRDGWGAQIDLLISNWLEDDVDARETYIGFKDHDRKELLELIDMASGVATAILEHAWSHGRLKEIDAEMTTISRVEIESGRREHVSEEPSELDAGRSSVKSNFEEKP